MTTTDFTGTTLPAGWTFTSPVAGGSHTVTGGRVTLTGTGTTARDTVTASTSADSSIRISRALPDHGGHIDVAAEFGTDVGERRGWAINVVLHDGSGGSTGACARNSVFKHGSGGSVNAERPNFFFSCKPSGASGPTAYNASVDVSSPIAHELMSGMAGFLRTQYTPTGGTPLSGMPAAGTVRGMFSTDGATWVEVTSQTVDFTPTEVRLEYSLASGGTAGSVDVEAFYDLLELGTADLRAATPARAREAVCTIRQGDNALDSDFWVDDSKGAGSSVAWSGGLLRFTDLGTQDARAASTARIRYVGPEVTEGGLILRCRASTPHASFFATPALLADLGDHAPIAFSSVTRTTNVAVATLGSGHGLRQGMAVNVSGVADSSFNNQGVALTAHTATSVSWASTGTDGTDSGGGTLTRPYPIDQYVRGPGYGLEVIMSGTVRRPIRVDRRIPDDSDVLSAPGSTQLDERPYFHMRQGAAAASLDLATGNTVLFELQRLRGDHQRFRARSWLSVGSDIDVDVAAGESVEWTYMDSQDDCILGAFGPALSLSHNGTKTSTAVLDVSYLEFYELSAVLGPKVRQTGAWATPACKVRQAGAWSPAAVKRRTAAAWV